MHASADTALLEKFLRPMSRGLSLELARALVDLKTDEDLQTRYEALAKKNTEDKITVHEREELESLVRVNTLLGLLKIEAQAVVQKAQ